MTDHAAHPTQTSPRVSADREARVRWLVVGGVLRYWIGAVLAGAILALTEQGIHTSVPVDVSRYRLTFDGPATAPTAQGRPGNGLAPSLHRAILKACRLLIVRGSSGMWAGVASRRASSAQPGRVCLVQVERPAGRTTWTRQTRSGCLRCAMGWRDPAIPEQPRVQGREPRPPEAFPGRRAGGPTRRRLRRSTGRQPGRCLDCWLRRGTLVGAAGSRVGAQLGAAVRGTGSRSLPPSSGHHRCVRAEHAWPPPARRAARSGCGPAEGQT